MSTDLRRRLSAIDPVQHLQPYSTAEQELLVQRIVSSRESAPPAADSARSQQDRSRPHRRPVLVPLSAAAAVALAVAVLSQGLSTPPAPDGGILSQDASADPARHDAAVVTLALEKLAATVTGPAPDNAYLYTRTRLKEERMDHVAGESSFRYAATTTIQDWQGTTCQDRRTVTWEPMAFPSAEDRQAALARSRDQIYLRELIDGGTRTWTGADLRALDDIPCDRLGTITHPNPPYIATFPTTTNEFLAKIRRDLAADANATDVPVEAGLMTVLETPWLSDLQRAAGLRAFAQMPGLWKVSGEETVAGIRGLRVVLSEPGTALREELVLAGRAPGVLRRTYTLTDLSKADPVNRASYLVGLAPGTVTYDWRVLTVATVPHLPTKG